MPGLYLMNISGIMLISLDKVTMSQAEVIIHTAEKETLLSQELWERIKTKVGESGYHNLPRLGLKSWK